MTRYRLITLLTILMLVLSIALAGAWVWVWVGLKNFSNIGGHGYSGMMLITSDDLNTIGRQDVTAGVHEDGWLTLGEIWYDIEVGSLGPVAVGSLLPIRVTDTVTIHSVMTTGYSLSDSEVLQLLHQEFRSGAIRFPKFHNPQASLQLHRTLDQGAGTHTRIYWPGVAQRIRIYAPRALALTGLLTLAGFTTLMIHRRALRNRLRRGHCLNCAYDLRGLASPTKCPECGHTLPPSPLKGEDVAGGGAADR